MGLSEIGIKIDSCCLKAKDQRTKAEKKRTTSSTKENVEKQLSVSECTPFGSTLLHLASNSGNETDVKQLIEQDQSLFNKQTRRCDTALHIAARFGHKGTAEALVRFQLDLIGESSSSENRGSIIGDYTWEAVFSKISSSKTYKISKKAFLAKVKQAEKSHVNDVIRLLQRYEVHDMISNKYPSVRLPNAKGNTPLHEAIAYRREEVVSFLINLDQEVWFYLNNERKSPLFLAVEAGLAGVVEVMLSPPVEEFKPWSEVAPEKFKKWSAGKSPIHAAIMAENKDILNTLLVKEPRFVHVENQEGLTPLQFAASFGYIDEVNILLASDPTTAAKRHKYGSLPIHLASMRGHVDIIRNMLPYYDPDHPRDILDKYGRNILHVAALNGKSKVVSYILKDSQLHTLVDERDNYGNTSLHLATRKWHPKIVSTLSWHKEKDVHSINGDGWTALDIAEKRMGRSPSFRKRLTWTALKAAGASRCLKIWEHDKAKADTLDMDKYKDMVNTLLLVSVLVATVTFAAGFTMPGGYNDSESDKGMAIMLRNSKFHLFLFCDTIAMNSSILVALILILAQVDNILVLNALKLALPLLGISLTTMCLAFMVGVSLVVGKLKWLNVVVLIMGLVFLVTITTFFFFLFLSILSSHNRIMRYLSYYPYQLVFLATETNNEDGHVRINPKVTSSSDAPSHLGIKK